MGYPINNYSLFKTFIKKDINTLKNIFKADFALYGFLVHDPENRAFNQKLEESFFNLHLATRKDLLFTAFVDPPESWMEWVRKNRIRFGDFYFSEQIHNPENIVKTFNPSLVSNFICQYLKIPSHKLPFLIVSDDLSKPGYYVVELNAESLMEAFMGLCEISYYNTDMSLDVFFERIYSKVRVTKIATELPLAIILLNLSALLSELSSGKEQNHRVTNELKSVFTDEFNKLSQDPDLRLSFEGLRLLQDKNPVSLRSPMEFSDILGHEGNYSSRTLMTFDLRLAETPPRKINFREETFALLERSTQILLLQGIELYNAYTKHYFDASAHLFSFAKAFETELTYSLTHWVREQYSIDLPRFFYEYEPGKNATINIGRGVVIDFNKSIDQQWACPELGGQLGGFKTTKGYSRVHPFSTDEMCQSFLDIAYNLKRIRNRAVHKAWLGKKELDQVVDHWEDLLNKDYFKDLYALKLKYRGG